MTLSFHFYLRLLLLLVALSAILSGVILIWRKRKKNFGTPEVFLIGERRKVVLPTNFLLGLIVGAMCFLPIGYFYRDHQLASNTFTRANLEVKQVFPAGNAELIMESGKKMNFNPCPGSVIPFAVGVRFEEIQFEQKKDCKVVRYFSVKPDPRGQIPSGEIANAKQF